MLRRIAFVVFAQRIGLTLDEIGGELAKLSSAPSAYTSRLVTALSHVDIANRRAHRRASAPRGSGSPNASGVGVSLDCCRLANPDDRAARLGLAHAADR